MVEFDEGQGPELTFPDEPEALRAALREALLDGQQWSDGPEGQFGQWLWDRWRSALEPEGLGPEQFAAALESNRRERWLWVMGQRQWRQFLEGQAGRIRRRLPHRAEAKDPAA